jgi:phosphate acetyltransferase
MSSLVNRTFDEIAVGETVSAGRTLSAADLRAWGAAFGNQDVLSASGQSQDAAGLVTGILVALAGSRLPGPGSSIRAASVRLEGPLPVGAKMTARLVVREKLAGDGVVVLDGACTDAAGRVVATAILDVLAPTVRQVVEVAEHRLEGLLDACRELEPMLTGVVHPCSADALAGAVAAAAADLIVPVLYGPGDGMKRIAEAAKLDISRCRIVEAATPEDAARAAAMAAGAGELGALMKGSLHTDQFLHAIMQAESRLRAARTLSHCALMSAPTYSRRFILTDVALNIAPTTDQKRDICQNAIGFARAVGMETPKVAVLAAVEMVETRMQATVDGAILAKMADRGQIVDGVVDGPLDLDAAVDIEAAKVKHITSPVAGIADVLLVPNIDAGNMVYKNLSFMADAQMAGIVVGARVPAILTSRADTVATRLFSAAASVLYAAALVRDPGVLGPTAAG